MLFSPVLFVIIRTGSLCRPTSAPRFPSDMSPWPHSPLGWVVPQPSLCSTTGTFALALPLPQHLPQTFTWLLSIGVSASGPSSQARDLNSPAPTGLHPHSLLFPPRHHLHRECEPHAGRDLACLVHVSVPSSESSALAYNRC